MMHHSYTIFRYNNHELKQGAFDTEISALVSGSNTHDGSHKCGVATGKALCEHGIPVVKGGAYELVSSSPRYFFCTTEHKCILSWIYSIAHNH